MKKVDKLTKTCREIDMPENSEISEYSPLRNFEIYLERLHPQCNRLWQFPVNVGSKADTNMHR
jgi:hypothetical protein